MIDDRIYIMGIDEAGRGPVIGPMVIVGVIATPSQIDSMNRHVKKDSKKYSPLKRHTLYEYIYNIAKDILIRKISPSEIDEWVLNKEGLNEMEAYYTADLIKEGADKYGVTIVYVDACDAQEENYKDRIIRYLGDRASKLTIISEHKADERYTIVSAASIVAKIVRDREIEILKEKYGDFGSGYPSDPRTQEFISKTKDINKLTIVRKSWKPIRKMLKNQGIKDLGEYIGDNR